MKKTPVVVIGFLRKAVLEATLNNLAEAEGVSERDIYVYLSSPRNDVEKSQTDAVRRFVENFKQNVLQNIIIVLRDKNEGAGRNIRFAVTETLKQIGRAIIIEDDVLVSKTFLRYMDEALEFYKDDKRIFCINGYQCPNISIPPAYGYDVYLNLRNMAWGWGTWQDRWEKVDFELKDWPRFKGCVDNIRALNEAGADLVNMIQEQYDAKIDTWDVQCSFHMVMHRMYGVEPRYSLTKNIGFNAEGSAHCKKSDPLYACQRYYNYYPRCSAELCVDDKIAAQFRWAITPKNLCMRILRKIRRVLSILHGDNMRPYEVSGSGKRRRAGR